ncbi:hypothetical protein HAX54_000564, partial [Datura stramonium]|nr:hypothetical protein [Datura stramonium]
GAKLLDEHRLHHTGQATQGSARGAGTSFVRPDVTCRRGTAAPGAMRRVDEAGSKRARRPSEEEHEVVRMAPLPLRRYCLRWVTEKE